MARLSRKVKGQGLSLAGHSEITGPSAHQIALLAMGPQHGPLHMPSCTLFPLLACPSRPSRLFKPHLPMRTKMKSNTLQGTLTSAQPTLSFPSTYINSLGYLTTILFFHSLIHSFNKYDPSYCRGYSVLGLSLIHI